MTNTVKEKNRNGKKSTAILITFLFIFQYIPVVSAAEVQQTATVTKTITPVKTFTPIKTVTPVATTSTPTSPTSTVSPTGTISTTQLTVSPTQVVLATDTQFLQSTQVVEPVVVSNPVQTSNAVQTFSSVTQPQLGIGDEIVTITNEDGTQTTSIQRASTGQSIATEEGDTFNELGSNIPDPDTVFSDEPGNNNVSPNNNNTNPNTNTNNNEDPTPNFFDPFGRTQNNSSAGGGGGGSSGAFLDSKRGDNPNLMKSSVLDKDFVGGGFGAGMKLLQKMLSGKNKKKTQKAKAKKDILNPEEMNQSEERLNKDELLNEEEKDKKKKKQLKKRLKVDVKESKEGMTEEQMLAQAGAIDTDLVNLENIATVPDALTDIKEPIQENAFPLEVISDLSPVHQLQVQAVASEIKTRGKISNPIQTPVRANTLPAQAIQHLPKLMKSGPMTRLAPQVHRIQPIATEPGTTINEFGPATEDAFNDEAK